MPLSDAAADPPPESETEMDEDEYEYEEVEVEEEEDEIEEEEEDEEWEEEDIDEAGAEVDEELVSSDVVGSRRDEDGETAENAEGLTLLNESNHKKPETDAGVEAVEGTENVVKLTKAIAEDNTKEAPNEKGAAEIAIGLTACKKEDNRKAQGLEEYAAEVAEGQAPTFINYQKEENGHVLEPARLDKLLGSNSATPQEPLANPPLAFSVLGDNNDNYRTTCSNEANEGKEPTSDGNKALGDDVNISLDEGGVMHEKDFGCKTSAEILGVDITDHEAAVVEDMDISPRSDVPLSRSRSLPSGSECNDQNKRPAIVCDFFAKGWCIKGTSCRFLHVRDNAASSPKESRVDAKLKGIHEGLKDTTAISAKIVPSDPALAWIEREATLRSKSGEEVPVRKSDPLSASSLKVIDIANDLEHKPYLANYSHSSSQTFGNGSFGKGLPSKSYQTDGVPTHLSHLEDIRSKGSQFKHDGSPVLQKIVEGGKERSVSGSVISLQNRSPLISGSEPDLISHAGVSAFTQRSYLYKPRPSFDHWEPSVPFRPSFLITRRMLSEASLYDPIRDCIEQTNALDKPSQSPLSGQGASALGTQKADPSLDPEQSPNKHSVSSHSSHQDTVWRNLTVKENEPKDTAGAPPEKIRTSLKGKQLLNDSNFRENTESEKARYSNHSVQKNGSKCKMELKAEKTKGQNNVDELVHQEPRKLFQTSLVEFIKQLLKPTWHLGLVSRDAYKVIVKKTADKALGALQTEHIPDNPESVKEYLSCVQPKLEKLVNGYVDKYGQL